jgi:hypothetical protein
LRWLMSGLGISYFIQVDKVRVLHSLLDVAEHSKTQPFQQYREKSAPTKHRSTVSYLHLGISIPFLCGLYYMSSYSWDDIMYVTKRTFQKTTDVLHNAIQFSQKTIFEMKREIQERFGIIEKQVETSNQKLETVQYDILSIHSKLENAEKERRYANRGIFLLCKTVSENMDGISSELHDFCTVPVAKVISSEYSLTNTSEKLKALFQWSSENGYSKFTGIG